MPSRHYIAIDLGAESGRVVLGSFDGQRFGLRELHRFPNGPVEVSGTLHWDALRLWSEIKTGLRKAAAEAAPIAGIGVDSWGVDFALLDAKGALLANPVHYRDARTEGMMDEAFRRVPREEVFHRTGIQFMRINTLYQLLAMRLGGSPLLDIADKFVMIGDFFVHLLCGQAAAEFTNATTTQLYDPWTGGWSEGLFEAMDLPLSILPEIVPPGTVMGPLRRAVQDETRLGDIPIISPATHDTGSAVAAVPADGDNWAYLSSGTWSLIGAEVPEPVINERSLELNFTNEGGVEGTFRLLKNITGLWILAQCRKGWAAEGRHHSYAELAQMAETAQSFAALIDADDPSFLAPGDMVTAISDFCCRTGQPPPSDAARVTRCIFESLALKYRSVRDMLNSLLEGDSGQARPIESIHIVGGGSQNELLNQFAANATGIPVLAGPVEATALGNIAVQAISQGDLGSIAEARQVIRDSFDLKTFDPQDQEAWREAYERYGAVAL